MSGPEYDPSQIIELASRNLDDMSDENDRSRLIAMLREQPQSRDAWIAEVVVDDLLQTHFQQQNATELRRAVNELAESALRRRKRRRFLLRSVGGLAAALMLVVLPFLLLPAVQASRRAARRTLSRNNMKQIGLGLHNFHAVHGALPAAYSIDAQGRPLLSWRVHLLPFLEQEDLFNRFHLDEPWNSPHNLELLDEMPSVFRSPLSSHQNKTVYLAIPTEDGMIRSPMAADAGQANQLGTSFGEVIDGTSNTVMVVEVSSDLDVPWTRPHDYPVKPGVTRISTRRVKRAMEMWKSRGIVACDRVLFGDGSVREWSGDLPRSLVTKAGREPPPDSL